MNVKDLLKRYRIEDNPKFRMSDIDPGDTWKIKSKDAAHKWLARDVERLSDLQAKLYAQNEWSVLLIFQAMDAAGKDSTIKHVMSGVNPQGCQVSSFKAPSAEDLSHDFLWRCHRCMPERGRIGIFNRSYYEETLIVRVHPDVLAHENLPPSLLSPKLWEERFEDINAFERYLTRNGIIILKFYLHLSKEEQRQRFLSRLEEPEKNWKFSKSDLAERRLWDDYSHAYQELVRHTSTKRAPWYVVPADHKWFTRLVVAAAVVHALESLHLKYPVVDASRREELSEARRQLLASKAA